jgi:hydroxymethylglutaryl-CoA synthase
MTHSHTENHPGLSGISVYVPPLKVELRDWCTWTGAAWSKVEAVVGRSFRMCGHDESVYTMAASAALRLLRQYDVDPARIGMVALGTESSTDNAAGAVIVKGMVDQALREQGLPPLSRHCEVPEIKHACLGGIYALKQAIRYLQTDGHGRQALVLCGDVAEYERGSSGEQTQGAGAVAMLVEGDARLLRVDLERAGSAAAYRGADFRKPVRRHFINGYNGHTTRLHDFPVFNGRYSTFCYLDEVVHAFADLLRRGGVSARTCLESVDAILMHRPYAGMPSQALATLFVWGLAAHPGDAEHLFALCKEAGVDPEAVRAEVTRDVDLFAHLQARGPDDDPYPALAALARHFRKSAAFAALEQGRSSLGADTMRDLGNLYTASLPAWIAAAFEDASSRDVDLAGRRLLLIGYGSGDAAEAIPAEVAPGWRAAAAHIGLAGALDGATTLTRAQYEALHDRGEVPGLSPDAAGAFRIARIGQGHGSGFQDIGLEYYRYEG